MSDPLVQELQAAALQLISARDAWGETIHHPPLHAAQERTINVLTRAALALDAAHQREEAHLFRLALVKRLLLQEAVDEALHELDGIDAAADLRQAGRADRDPAVPGLSDNAENALELLRALSDLIAVANIYSDINVSDRGRAAMERGRAIVSKATHNKE